MKRPRKGSVRLNLSSECDMRFAGGCALSLVNDLYSGDLLVWTYDLIGKKQNHKKASTITALSRFHSIGSGLAESERCLGYEICAGN